MTYTDTDTKELIARAIGKACEAYEKEFSQDGIEVAYFPLSLKVHVLSQHWEELETVEYHDKQVRNFSQSYDPKS